MELFEAINYRRSTRKYKNESLSQDLLEQVHNIVRGVDRLYNDIDMKVHLIKDGVKIQNIMSGIIGNYGKVKAPHFLVITSQQTQGYYENIGYTLEKVVLELTRLEIATCWLGGHIKKQDLERVIEMDSIEQPVVLISFGYAENKEDALRKNSTQAKRKSISQIASGEFDKDWSKIMDAVRMAPSAANVQPWKFIFEGKKAHLMSSKPASFLTKRLLGEINRLDSGIALRHVEIMAKHLSKNIIFKKMDLAEPKGMNYITSIIEI